MVWAPTWCADRSCRLPDGYQAAAFARPRSNIERRKRGRDAAASLAAFKATCRPTFRGPPMIKSQKLCQLRGVFDVDAKAWDSVYKGEPGTHGNYDAHVAIR